MKIKFKTLIKGLLWEAIGVIALFFYTWLATGNIANAMTIGFVYPLFRALTWYPYERLFKYVYRNYLIKNGLDVPRLIEEDKQCLTHGIYNCDNCKCR